LWLILTPKCFAEVAAFFECSVRRLLQDFEYRLMFSVLKSDSALFEDEWIPADVQSYAILNTSIEIPEIPALSAPEPLPFYGITCPYSTVVEPNGVVLPATALMYQQDPRLSKTSGQIVPPSCLIELQEEISSGVGLAAPSATLKH
jgi:hypothetical protein